MEGNANKTKVVASGNWYFLRLAKLITLIILSCVYTLFNCLFDGDFIFNVYLRSHIITSLIFSMQCIYWQHKTKEN